MFDLIIIGAGVAGASGAMYASRLNIKTGMIGEMPGGLITTTHLVENWPGHKSISGPDLAMNILDHATSFGVPFINESVTEIKKAVSTPPEGKQSGFVVKTASNEYFAKSVMFATGTKHRKLNVSGEKEFENKGVSYCALCDGAFFKDKPVCVVGSGDSAAKEALMLTELCSKVFLFIRKDKLKAEPINKDRVNANEKIEVRFNTQIEEILGDGKVEKVKLNTGEEVELSAVFAAIGHNALSGIAEGLGVELNEKKEIKIDRNSSTSMEGVFAAGDVTDSDFKQAITGASEAVTGAYHASLYLGMNEVVFE